MEEMALKTAEGDGSHLEDCYAIHRNRKAINLFALDGGRHL